MVKSHVIVIVDAFCIVDTLGLAKLRPLGLAKLRPLGLAKLRPLSLAKLRPLGLAKRGLYTSIKDLLILSLVFIAVSFFKPYDHRYPFGI